MKKFWTVILCMALWICSPAFFVGCGKAAVPVDNIGASDIEKDDDKEKEEDEDDPNGTGKEDTNTEGSDDATTGDAVDMSEFTKTISLVWSGTEVDVKNETNLKVTCEGGHVTIGEAGAAGAKVRINLSGTSGDGSLKIYNGVKSDDTNKKMLLFFSGLNLTSSKGPAINVQSGKTVYAVLKDGTSNTLCDAVSYAAVPVGEDAKGCFFSEKQLVFSGKGSLTLQGRSKHAIAVDDYMHIYDGTITVQSAEVDGVHTNAYLRVDGGSLSITSKGEAIQCENEEVGYFYMTGGKLTLNTSGQKCGGIETAADIRVEGGELNVTATGAAAKCLKSANNITVGGGTLVLKTTGAGVYDSADRDVSGAACMRAENNINLNGGNINCTSTGNGGKGLNAYTITIEDGVSLTVSTSGTVYSYSSSLKSRPKAIKATSLVKINGGDVNVTTTGTEGEGIESKAAVEINGGKVIVNAKDDGINAATTITFNGGYTYVYSTGNDGIDSNYNRANSIVVNGGVVMSHSANSPEEAFDADNHAYLTFKGGYVFATGGQQGGGGGGGRPGGWPGGGGTSGSNPSCTQPSFMWSTSASKGYFTIADASGKVVMSCYVPRAMSGCYVMASAPLSAGASYKCGFTGSAPTGVTEVFGKYFYNSGTQTGLSKTFTAASGYTTL